MRLDQRVSRRRLAAIASLAVAATVAAALARVPSTMYRISESAARDVRRLVQRSIVEARAIAELPRRAIEKPGQRWSSTYDDTVIFIQNGASRQIHVDQIGYRSADAKIAKLTTRSETFSVVDASSGRVVFRGQPDLRASHDPASGDTVFDLDFSAVAAPGRYYLVVSGVGRSFEFSIGNDVYNSALRMVLRGFYLQRCGCDVLDESWGHAACHLGDARAWDQPTRRVDVTGGWHDAGDYGKYVPTAARAVGTLLAAYELYPDRFPLTTVEGAPSVLPDILTETRWELDWLRRMQAADGGVYHKVTPRDWDGYAAPADDRSDRFVFGVSTAATASFAAVMAAASRVYAVFDNTFATEARLAAERAWSYLEQNPRIEPLGGFHNPPGVTTGEYADADDSDERFWAAAELFRTTGKPTYDAYARDAARRWRSYFSQPPTVTAVQALGALAYLLAEPPGGDGEIKRVMRDDLVDAAKKIVARARAQAYQVALAPDEYYWGSNGVALSYALVLLFAEHLAGQSDAVSVALDQLHYIFGRNSLGKSFVTGVGTNPVMRPHHEAVIATEEDAPPSGLLSGGPNAVDASYLSRFPARDYVDSSDAFAVNETAIDMNATLVFVLARFAEPSTGGHPTSLFLATTEDQRAVTRGHRSWTGLDTARGRRGLPAASNCC